MTKVAEKFATIDKWQEEYPCNRCQNRWDCDNCQRLKEWLTSQAELKRLTSRTKERQE